MASNTAAVKPHEHDHNSHYQHHHHHEGREAEDHDDDDFTSRNQAHWNNFASKYTAEAWQREMIADISNFIHTLCDSDFLYPFSTSSPPRVLDYACGPGTVTAALGSRCKEYVGIDLSEEMVKTYNARFGSEGSGTEEEKKVNAHAEVGNLLTKEPPTKLNEEEFNGFDMVVIGLGFHHFEDLELCIARLKDRLKVGGTFAIVDLVTHAPEDKYKKIVAHHGFSEHDVRELFGNCGLKNVGWSEMEKEVFMHGKSPRKVFVARGTKEA